MPLSAPNSLPAAHHAAHMDLRPMPLLESPGTKAARDATPNDEHQSQIVPAPPAGKRLLFSTRYDRVSMNEFTHLFCFV
jgi:hypothetical protein